MIFPPGSVAVYQVTGKILWHLQNGLIEEHRPKFNIVGNPDAEENV